MASRHEAFMMRQEAEAERLRLKQAMDQSDAKDMINSPPHYNQGDIECIDAIESALGPEGFSAYCRGNAIKYLWRAELKHDNQDDWAKANWYINRATGRT